MARAPMHSKQPGAVTIPRFSASRKILPLDMFASSSCLHPHRRGLAGIEAAAHVVVVMALHAAAHRTGLGGSVEDRPAVGKAPRIGPRQPQPVKRALPVLLGMVLEAGPRVQHGLVAQDLEITRLEMHAEHVLR